MHEALDEWHVEVPDLFWPQAVAARDGGARAKCWRVAAPRRRRAERAPGAGAGAVRRRGRGAVPAGAGGGGGRGQLLGQRGGGD
eukprot:2364697-Prymnesium_polylepis.1